MNLSERIGYAVLAGLMVLMSGAQAYKAGQHHANTEAFYEGYAEGCATADRQQSTKDNDEVGSLCMEAQPDGDGVALKSYSLDVRRNGADYVVRVQAPSMKEAKTLVMAMERCPAQAIVWVHRVENVSRMGA